MNTPRARALALLLIAAALGTAGLPEAALADVVVLKDGSRISGRVLSKGKRLLRIKDDRGKIHAVRLTDVERIEEGEELSTEDADAERDAKAMPGLSLEQRKAVRARCAPWAEATGIAFNAAARPRVHAFGDMKPPELSRLAEAMQRTYDDYCARMGCTEEAPLERSDAGELTLVQFREEPQYLRFIDRVFDRIRDETVDDRRLKLMRRQQGFWVLTPRPIVVRYRGPSVIEGLVSNASHQASHSLLLLHDAEGGWMPWWLLEGFAVWQEIRLTGHALTYCINVSEPGDYAKAGTPEANEAAKAKLQKAWRAKVRGRVAARDERGLTALGKASLNELELPDVQEAWSVVEWLAARSLLADFVTAYKREKTLEATCQLVFKKTTDGVHEDWRTWVLANY